MSKLIPARFIVNYLHALTPTIEDNPFNEDIIQWELFSLKVQKLFRNKEGITYNELRRGMRNMDCTINKYPGGYIEADGILLRHFSQYSD